MYVFLCWRRRNDRRTKERKLLNAKFRLTNDLYLYRRALPFLESWFQNLTDRNTNVSNWNNKKLRKFLLFTNSLKDLIDRVEWETLSLLSQNDFSRGSHVAACLCRAFIAAGLQSNDWLARSQLIFGELSLVFFGWLGSKEGTSELWMSVTLKRRNE